MTPEFGSVARDRHRIRLGAGATNQRNRQPRRLSAAVERSRLGTRFQSFRSRLFSAARGTMAGVRVAACRQEYRPMVLPHRCLGMTFHPEQTCIRRPIVCFCKHRPLPWAALEDVDLVHLVRPGPVAGRDERVAASYSSSSAPRQAMWLHFGRLVSRFSCTRHLCPSLPASCAFVTACFEAAAAPPTGTEAQLWQTGTRSCPMTSYCGGCGWITGPDRAA